MSRDKQTGCRCPFCESPLPEKQTFCAPCGVEVRYCDQCGKPLPKDAVSCPDCPGRHGTKTGRNR